MGKDTGLYHRNRAILRERTRLSDQLLSTRRYSDVWITQREAVEQGVAHELREFTVPKKVTVAGKEQAPEFISVKVVNYGATMGAGKSYFTNFRLSRVESKSGEQPGSRQP